MLGTGHWTHRIQRIYSEMQARRKDEKRVADADGGLVLSTVHYSNVRTLDRAWNACVQQTHACVQ